MNRTGLVGGTAIRSVAEKLGCPVEVLGQWVRQAERDAGTRPGLSTDEHHRLKQLERENVELKRTNEILRKVSAFFAQAELDRRAKSSPSSISTGTRSSRSARSSNRSVDVFPARGAAAGSDEAGAGVVVSVL